MRRSSSIRTPLLYPKSRPSTSPLLSTRIISKKSPSLGLLPSNIPNGERGLAGLIKYLMQWSIDIGAFANSMIVIGAVCMIGVIAYILYKYVHPRVPTMCHKASIDDFNLAYYTSLKQSWKDFKNVGDNDRTVQRVRQALVKCDTIGINDDDWKFLAQFYHLLAKRMTNGSVTNWHAFFASFETSLISGMAPERIRKRLVPSDTGRGIDEKAFEQYRSVEVSAMLELRASLANMRQSTQISKSASIASAQRLDLLLNEYLDEQVSMYDNRKRSEFMGFQFHLTLMKTYVSSFADYVFVDMIQNKIWAPFWSNFESVYDTVINLWARVLSALEDTLNSLLNSEAFCPEPSNCNIMNGGDLHEGFFGFLFAPVKFALTLMRLVLAFMRKLDMFVTNPLAFIMWVIMVIAIVILLQVLIIIDPILRLAFYPIAIAATFSLSVIVTIAWVILFTIVSILFLILTIIDIPTGGLILTILSCENLPHDWAMRQVGNAYQRILPCYLPCPSRYTPWFGGLLCGRDPDERAPLLCPQQYIYQQRFLETPFSPSTPSTYPQQVPITTGYISGNEHQRLKLVRAHMDSVRKFRNRCDIEFTKRDKLLATDCNIMFPNGLTLSDNDINDKSVILHKLCVDAFCHRNNMQTSLTFCPSDSIIDGTPVTDLYSNFMVYAATGIAILACVSATYIAIIRAR